MDSLLTADDLLRLSAEGVRGELVRGVLHETMAAGHRQARSWSALSPSWAIS
ncbi:MAG: hypothetical protein OXT07_16150 [bacterium]|nr:hypothetical protein [bacterium]MDE0215596.1 hypothetical protein [bacterium]